MQRNKRHANAQKICKQTEGIQQDRTAEPCEPTWAGVLELQLISRHDPELRVILREDKVGNPLLVQGDVPAHCDVLPRLCFLEAFVIISLQLDKRPKHILIHIRIIIPATPRQQWQSRKETLFRPCFPGDFCFKSWSLSIIVVHNQEASCSCAHSKIMCAQEDTAFETSPYLEHQRLVHHLSHYAGSNPLQQQRCSTDLRATWAGSSSSPGLSMSSTVALGLPFQASSRRLIWAGVMWRALSSSASVGATTSHGTKALSSAMKKRNRYFTCFYRTISLITCSVVQ